MFKKLAIAAFAAVFPFTVTAACLSPDAHVNNDHFAYWVDSQGATWVDSQGVCWRTINDDSYHNTLEEALACGDAEEYSHVVVTRILVHFDFDKSLLKSVDTAAVLDAIDVIQRQYGRDGSIRDVEVSVVGHTDHIGSDAYNLALGLRRAGALAEFLRSHGVEVASVDTMGEADPVASNATAEGRALNRRAEGTIEVLVRGIRRK